ncbi:MAG TPA: PDZ domain-containing protein [Gemmataceae bacterium]|nr:PDZ domain-containing protein [Gemmataceae bacterium]
MKWTFFSIFALCVASFCTTPLLADDEPGYLGVQIKNAPDGDGVVIVMVLKDSSAHEGELQADDVIKKIDGKAVTTVQGFVASIRETKPGTKIKLTLIRNGQEKDVEIKLGKRSDNK